MEKIIDFHIHLGDIFHGNLNRTFKTNIKRPERYDDHFSRNGRSGFTFSGIYPDPEEQKQRILQGQYRCWDATLENCGKAMDETGLTNAVAHPILPNTSFEEYLAASKLDERILPFASADFTLPIAQMQNKLRQDISHGAKGLKIHGILQNVALTDSRTFAAIEVFGEAGLPIIFHIGAAQYYFPEQPYKCTPEYGILEDFFTVCHRYPQYLLVGAHYAKHDPAVIQAHIKTLPNVYFETSMASAAKMQEAVDILGADRVLFGTDYPFSAFIHAIAEVHKAFDHKPEVRDKVFYHNAARLLQLE